jgi:hypothetical protein
MVSTAVRADPVLGVTVTVTVPEPVPLAGLTVAQVDVPSALHPQPELLAATFTVTVPPAAAAAHEVADSP